MSDRDNRLLITQNLRRDRITDQVGAIALQLDDGDRNYTTFTVTVDPPNVLGYDGAPLAPSQIEGVVDDMRRYQAVLEQSA